MGNHRVVQNGRQYHSKLEAGDALWLRSLQDRGLITDLREQVRYDFVINGQRLKQYALVDFQFKRNGKTVWYETKGGFTLQDKYWRLKKSIIEATLPAKNVYIVNGDEKQILTI